MARAVVQLQCLPVPMASSPNPELSSNEDYCTPIRCGPDRLSYDRHVFHTIGGARGETRVFETWRYSSRRSSAKIPSVFTPPFGVTDVRELKDVRQVWIATLGENYGLACRSPLAHQLC